MWLSEGWHWNWDLRPIQGPSLWATEVPENRSSQSYTPELLWAAYSEAPWRATWAVWVRSVPLGWHRGEQINEYDSLLHGMCWARSKRSSRPQTPALVPQGREHHGPGTWGLLCQVPKKYWCGPKCNQSWGQRSWIELLVQIWISVLLQGISCYFRLLGGDQGTYRMTA